jgi:hypothetical protein
MESGGGGRCGWNSGEGTTRLGQQAGSGRSSVAQELLVVRVGVISRWSGESADSDNGGCGGAGHAHARRKEGRPFIAKGVEESSLPSLRRTSDVVGDRHDQRIGMRPV